MKKLTKALASILALSIAVSLMGCASSNGLKEKGKLTVATNATFPPFEFMDNQKVTGIDIEISNAIAKDLGATLDVQNIEFNSVLAGVSSGKYDLGVSGVSKTTDREKSMDFSDSYFDASQVIIVKANNTTITDKDSLKGKKVAVQQGTTGDDLAKGIVGDQNVVRFTAATNTVSELKNGKVDAIILDKFPAQEFVKANSDLKLIDKPLSNEQYCIIVKKGNKALLEAVNKTIKKLKDSGDLAKIVAKYSK